MSHLSRSIVLTLSALIVVAPASDAQRRRDRAPQELRGTRASVEKMYRFARAHRMHFYLTPTNVNQAIAQGRLVPLTGGSTYELANNVGFSYATPEAAAFVAAFAPQFQTVCGTPLVVTSAARPMSRQPRNASPQSVHPTGIAVDFRRPYAGPCLTWLRGALAQLERKGMIEVTEERHPPHLHLAVLVPPGRPVRLPDFTVGAPRIPAVTAVSTVASVSTGDVSLPKPVASVPKPVASLPTAVADMGKPRVYKVRQGDTLWDIAKKHEVSVAALTKANKRSPKATLRPGTTLILPETTQSQ